MRKLARSIIRSLYVGICGTVSLALLLSTIMILGLGASATAFAQTSPNDALAIPEGEGEMKFNCVDTLCEGATVPPGDEGLESDDAGIFSDDIDAPFRAQAQEWIFSSQDYGYAGATFDWDASNSVRNIDLVVGDWGCDGEPVYAYFMWHDGSHWDSTPTRRYDYSGCDLGDYTTYNDLRWDVSGVDIVYMAVVICRDAWSGPCTVGNISDRNPYAPH